MQKHLVNLIQLLLLAGHALAKPVSKPEKFDWKKNEVVFAFGDSYTFTQGEYGLTNYSWNTFQHLDKHGNVIVKEDPIILNAVSAFNLRPLSLDGKQRTDSFVTDFSWWTQLD